MTIKLLATKKRQNLHNNSNSKSKIVRIINKENKTRKVINKKRKTKRKSDNQITIQQNGKLIQKGGSVNHRILKNINPFGDDTFTENHLNLFYGITFLDSNMVHNYNSNFINDKFADDELSNLGQVWKKLFHINEINEITIKLDIIKQINSYTGQNNNEKTIGIIRNFSTIISLYYLIYISYIEIITNDNLDYYKLLKLLKLISAKKETQKQSQKQSIYTRTKLNEDVFNSVKDAILQYNKYNITSKNVTLLNSILDNLKNIADNYVANIKSDNTYIKDYYYTQGIYVFHMLLYITIKFIQTGEHKYIFYNTMFNVIHIFKDTLDKNKTITINDRKVTVLETLPEKINLLFENIKSQGSLQKEGFQLTEKYRLEYTVDDDKHLKTLENVKTLYDFYYIKYNTHLKVGHYLTTTLFGKTFPDCGETFTRNLISLLIINDNLEYDLELLKKLGAGDKLIAFFTEFRMHKDILTQNIPNSSMRRKWALLVSNMKGDISYTHTKGKEHNSNTNVSYCISGSAKDFLAAINGLLPSLNLADMTDLNGNYNLTITKKIDRELELDNTYILVKDIGAERYEFEIDMNGHPEIKQINTKTALLPDEKTKLEELIISINEDNIFSKSLLEIILLKKINKILNYTYAFYYSINSFSKQINAGKYNIKSYILNENIKEYYIFLNNIENIGGLFKVNIIDSEFYKPESIYLVPFVDTNVKIIEFNTLVNNIVFYESSNNEISLNFKNFKGDLTAINLPLYINELILNSIPKNITDLNIKYLQINNNILDCNDFKLPKKISKLELNTLCLPVNISDIELEKLIIKISNKEIIPYTLHNNIKLLICTDFNLPSNILDLNIQSLSINKYEQLAILKGTDNDKYNAFIKRIRTIMFETPITDKQQTEILKINKEINIM